MKRIFISTILLCLLAAWLHAQNQPQGQRWVYVTSSKDFSTSAYYDAQTVQRVNSSVIIWQKFVELRDESYTLLQVQIYRDGRFRYLRGYEYTPEGNIKQSFTTPSEWQEAIPGSLQEAVIRVFTASKI